MEVLLHFELLFDMVLGGGFGEQRGSEYLDGRTLLVEIDQIQVMAGGIAGMVEAA